MIRLFLAIELPSKYKESFSSLYHGINHIKWTNHKQLHLTLHFLGEVSETKLPEIDLALQELTSIPFELQIKGVGHFTKHERTQTLWAALSPNEDLDFLYDETKERLLEIGLALPQKNFRPHITLAKCNSHTSPQQIIEFLKRENHFSLPPFTVNHISLFSSKLKPEGAVHSVEGSFTL